MNLEKHLPQSWRRSRWLWPIVAAVVLIIIIVIVVPCAVILTRKHHHKAYSASVLIPLYIYPSNDSSWDPLYNAVELHPNLNFTVIVNPDSGPGDNTIPDSQYTAALVQLNSYDNVRTVGYVRTGYASRNVTEVINEINIYSGWYYNSSTIAMHGIFFDEAPHQYTADAVDYMITVDEAAKNASGLQGSRTIIHNPGTVPASEFNTTHPDITVVFEDTYNDWSKKLTSVKAYGTKRTAYSLMVNSIPNMTNGTLRDYLADLSQMADYLFITNNTESIYESFASDWGTFIDELSTFS